MRRTVLAALFAGLAAIALQSAQQAPSPGSVQEIADGVWFRIGELDDEGHCNNVIIEMADYLVVVDANFPSGARKTMADIRKRSSKPVRYVFDTHHHGDHAYANAVWTASGATTLAYIGVVEEMMRYEPTRWQEAAATRPGVAEFKRDTVEPPMQTFRESPFVLEDSSRRVEFHHFGWAHTRGDGMAYLPAEKVLATGDAVVNGPNNYTGDGNTGNWPNVIRAAEKLDVEHVLPGHGPAGGREVLQGQRQFFEEITKHAERAVAAGGLDGIVEVKDGAGVSTTAKMSDAVQTWVGERLPEQIRVRYAELTEHRPHGEILAEQQ